jgi:hypothetical protein
MTKKSVYDVTLRKALQDPGFRERLVASPASAIEEATGESVPDDVEIVVVENTSQRFHIVLPPVELDLRAWDPSAGVNFDPEFHQLRPPSANWLLS